MTLIIILIGAILLGTGLQIMLDKMLNYKTLAEIYRNDSRTQFDENRKLRDMLTAAEKDMQSMLDCCDICLHNLAETNPDSPCECEECAIEACVCRNCRNSDHFKWRGIQTERRSGNDTGEDGNGVRESEETPKTVFTAQTGG